MRPGLNDRFVRRSGGVTVYRRPNGSEYGLDSQGRVGNFEGTGGTGGASPNPLAVIAFFACLILFPLVIVFGVLYSVAFILGKMTGHPTLHRHRDTKIIVGLAACLIILLGFVALSSHPSRTTATESPPASRNYTSPEVVAMVEQKVVQEGVFDASQESITCPEGSYTAGSVVTCTLNSSKGNGNFDVEVTGSGISIKMSDEGGAEHSAQTPATSQPTETSAQDKHAEEKQEEEDRRTREHDEAAKEREIRAQAKADEAEAARSREAVRSQQEAQEARMAKERTEESTAPGSMNKYPGETCVGPGEQEYKCSAAQKSESSPASRAPGR